MNILSNLLLDACPDGVPYFTFKSVAKLAKGVQFNKKDMLDEGTFPVINGGVLPSGYIEQYNCKRDTITISQGGASAGYVNWIESNFWAGAHCYIVEPSERIDNRYLYHFLKSKEYLLQSFQYGAGIPALSKATVEGLLIPVPPLEVQAEIVRILDEFTEKTKELNALIEKEIRLLAMSEQECLKEAFFAIDNEERDITELKDLCEFVTVGIASSATHAYAEDGIILFRNQNIKKNTLDDKDLIYITPSFANKYSSKKLKTNDILVTRTGYPGQACLVPEKYNGCQSFTTLIVRLKDFNRTDPAYICQYINSPYGKEYVDKEKTGAAQKNFGAKALGMMPIILPCIENQKKVARVLERVSCRYEDLIWALSQEMQKRQQQYDFYRDTLLTFPELKQ